jgi:predicted GNAT family acetyltransferase
MAEQSGGVTDNAAESRYEMAVGGKTAVLGYDRKDGVLYLNHTEVPEELEGQGIGSTLVKHVLDKARADGEKVAPWCPFVRTYIDRHSEYQDLVAQGE